MELFKKNKEKNVKSMIIRHHFWQMVMEMHTTHVGKNISHMDELANSVMKNVSMKNNVVRIVVMEKYRTHSVLIGFPMK